MPFPVDPSRNCHTTPTPPERGPSAFGRHAPRHTYTSLRFVDSPSFLFLHPTRIMQLRDIWSGMAAVSFRHSDTLTHHMPVAVTVLTAPGFNDANAVRRFAIDWLQKALKPTNVHVAIGPWNIQMELPHGYVLDIDDEWAGDLATAVRTTAQQLADALCNHDHEAADDLDDQMHLEDPRT